MDGVGSELPADLLERVLSLLPVPDLCRFRSVCKMWNSLICSPAFGKMCIQNASKGANTGAYLVVKLRVKSSSSYLTAELPFWSVFDLNARRWYNIKHALPTGYDFNLPAMDGGLVCTFVDPFTEEQHQESIRILNTRTFSDHQTLIISNLVDGTFKVLPAPPVDMYLDERTNLQLLVESVSNTYKVFLLNSRGSYIRAMGPWMCVYDSSISQWRIPPNPPTEWNEWGNHVRSIVFQGTLYILLHRPLHFVYQLYSFNYLENALEDTGVQMRQSQIDCFAMAKFEREVDFCDLVVSDNRLFLMTQRCVDRPQYLDLPVVYRRNRRPWLGWALDISEIRLPDKVCLTVVQVGDAEVRENFSLSDGDDFRIRPFGSDKSILLMCEETGKVMLYDLVTGTWDLLNPNPGERQQVASVSHGESDFCRISRLGKQMSYLRLPNTPF